MQQVCSPATAEEGLRVGGTCKELLLRVVLAGVDCCRLSAGMMHVGMRVCVSCCLLLTHTAALPWPCSPVASAARQEMLVVHADLSRGCLHGAGPRECLLLLLRAWADADAGFDGGLITSPPAVHGDVGSAGTLSCCIRHRAARAGVLVSWLAAAQVCRSSQPTENRQIMVLELSIWWLIMSRDSESGAAVKCTAFLVSSLLAAADEAQKMSRKLSTYKMNVDETRKLFRQTVAAQTFELCWHCLSGRRN